MPNAFIFNKRRKAEVLIITSEAARALAETNVNTIIRNLWRDRNKRVSIYDRGLR